VSDKVYGSWLKWINEEHVPFMLKTGAFSQPQVAKVLANETQEGTSFSVQFHIFDMPTLEIWNEQYGEEFEKSCLEKFGTEVLSFSTVLELIR
jgi:hypothetical protein